MLANRTVLTQFVHVLIPLSLGGHGLRHLIRPIVTQGHICDVLPDKIISVAQTTSGSGGPLFNSEGKVIGINFAIPISYGKSLLKP